MAELISRQRFIRFVKNDDDDNGVIDGVLTELEKADSYGDVIREGALDEWLDETKSIPMLWAHSLSEIMGEWTDFELKEFELCAKGKLFDGVRRADEYRNTRMRDVVKGVSIGFTSSDWSWGKKDDEYCIGFDKIDIKEASIVLYPAHESAKVTNVRNADGSLNLRAVERSLVNVGLTRTETKNILKPLRGMSDSVDEVSMRDSVAAGLLSLSQLKQEYLEVIKTVQERSRRDPRSSKRTSRNIRHAQSVRGNSNQAQRRNARGCA